VTESEHPEDEQRVDEQEPAAEAEPSAEAETEPQAGAAAEPATEAEAEEPEPEPEPQAEAEPEPEEPATVAEAEEPATEPQAEEPATEPEAEEPATVAEAEEPVAAPEAGEPEAEEPEAEEPAAAPQAEAEPVVAAEPGEEAELEEAELPPRERPEIPGADLIPDIVPEGEEFLDAEARAAAEAEAEAAAAREEADGVDEAQPIADAAIDLAAGARYTATGKRKSSVARVILKPGTGTYAINGKELDNYFPRETLQRIIRQPLEAVGYDSRMDVVARMHGGGVSSQAGALRHGISRALLVADPNLRGELKRRGFLTRDPRVKERKKAGLKKARKRPQFSKR
jgi:small subunit ribosomal protein S9